MSRGDGYEARFRCPAGPRSGTAECAPPAIPSGGGRVFDRPMTSTTCSDARRSRASDATMSPSSTCGGRRDGRTSSGRPMAALEVWSDRGYETVTLPQGVCTLGSDGAVSDVVVDDPAVSHV